MRAIFHLSAGSRRAPPNPPTAEGNTMSQSTTESPTLIHERTGAPVELIVFVLSLASVFAVMLAPHDIGF